MLVLGRRVSFTQRRLLHQRLANFPHRPGAGKDVDVARPSSFVRIQFALHARCSHSKQDSSTRIEDVHLEG